MAKAKVKDLGALLSERLQVLYAVEKEQVKTLPKIAKSSQHEELIQVLDDHLAETKEQVARLERVFEMTGAGKAKAKKTPVLEGRTFTESDRPGALPVVIVNKSFVKKYFPTVDPIGRRIRLGGPKSTAPYLTLRLQGQLTSMYYRAGVFFTLACVLRIGLWALRLMHKRGF